MVLGRVCGSVARVTIEPVVLLYVFAIFAEYAVVEDLLYVSKCFNHLNLTSNDGLHICVENKRRNHTTEPDDQVWKDISTSTNNALLLYNGVLYATSTVSSFVAAAFSDRHSKFVPIFIPVIGSALVQCIILLSLVVHNSSGTSVIFSHTSIILVCSFVSGMTGGTSTLLSNCFAYVAEKCSLARRTTRITIVEACLFGGGFFGFTYAGAVLRAHPNSVLRYLYNFGLFLGIHLLLAVYLLVRRNLFDQIRVSTEVSSDGSPNALRSCLSLFASVLRTVFRKRVQPHQRKLVLLILGAFTLISFWNVAITTLMFIYTRNPPLSWPSWMYSYFSSAKFALCGVCLVLLPVGQHVVSAVWQRPPVRDTTLVMVGMTSRALAIVLIGLATNTTLMVVGLCVIGLAEYPIPAIRSLLSKLIESNEKAQMFVFLATIQSVCFFVGGMVFPALYNVIDHFTSSSGLIGPFNGPGLLFVAIGALQFVALAIFVYVDRVIYNTNHGLIAQAPNNFEEEDSRFDN